VFNLSLTTLGDISLLAEQHLGIIAVTGIEGRPLAPQIQVLSHEPKGPSGDREGFFEETYSLQQGSTLYLRWG
jgi:hypothetical protein